MRGLIRDWHGLLVWLRRINAITGWQADGANMTLWMAPRLPGMSRSARHGRLSVTQMLCLSMKRGAHSSDTAAASELGFDADFLACLQRASSVALSTRTVTLEHGDRHRHLTLMMALRAPVEVPPAFRRYPPRVDKTRFLFPELVDADGRPS